MSTRTAPATLPRARAVTRAEALIHFERFRAPFFLRCGALLIDYVLIICIVTIGTLIARTLGGGARTAGGTAETLGIITAVVLTILDFVFLAAARGQTVGKWATGIRIVRLDGSELSFGQAFVRHFLGYPLSLLSLNFLLAGFNPDGRPLHDIIVGTIVVRVGARRAAARLRRGST